MNFIIPGVQGTGFTISDKFVHINEYHVLYCVGGKRLYFERTYPDTWTRISENAVRTDATIMHVLDPMTALIRGLATAEEIGLGGLDTLVALLKPV